jgi:hypothetical protein
MKAAVRSKLGFAQIVPFAKFGLLCMIKGRGRPFAALHRSIKILHRGPSLQPFVHCAAFCRSKRRSAEETDILSIIFNAYSSWFNLWTASWKAMVSFYQMDAKMAQN